MRVNQGDFPGGPVVKNPPANVGDMDLISGPEDPTCCETAKPEALTPQSPHNKKSHRNEQPMYHNEKWLPLAATGENPHIAMKTQCSQNKET